MATEKQIEANRRNAQKSTGPRTSRGKARVGGNARKRNAYGRDALLYGEDSDRLDSLVDAYEQHFQPRNPIESDLVFQLAATQHRMRRALRIDSSLLSARVEQSIEFFSKTSRPVNPTLLIGQAMIADADHDNALSKLSVYENRLGQRYERTRKQLEQLQAERKAQTKKCKTNSISACLRSPLYVGFA